MERSIYLNNGATSFPKPASVVNAIQTTLSSIPQGRGNGDAKSIKQCKENVASFFGVEDFRRIIYSQNVSYAINLFLQGVLKSGMRVAITTAEHASIIRPLNHMSEDLGIELISIPFDDNEEVDTESLSKIHHETPIDWFFFTHSSNVTGSVYNLNGIIDCCRNLDIKMGVDISQTAGLIPFNINHTDLDAFFFTGHKSLLGPVGVGCCYVKDIAKVKPVFYGGTGINSRTLFQPMDLEERFEVGTPNSISITGLSAGIDYVRERMAKHLAHKESLVEHTIKRLSDVEGINLYTTPRGKVNTGVVAFNVQGTLSVDVAAMLAKKGIIVRGGMHCAPLMHKHLGTFPNGCVRASFGHKTTFDEVDSLVDNVVQLANA